MPRRMNTIGRKLSAAIVVTSLVYSLLIAGLFSLTKAALAHRSNDYVRSFTLRFKEAVEWQFFDRAARLQGATPSLEALPAARAALPWADLAAVTLGRDGKLPADSSWPPAVRAAIGSVQWARIQVVGDPSRPDRFYIVYQLPDQSPERRSVVVAGCGYELLFNAFNDLLRDEKTQNGAEWLAGLSIADTLVWSPSPRLQGVRRIAPESGLELQARVYSPSLIPIPQSNISLLVLAPPSVFSDTTFIYAVGGLCAVVAFVVIWACLKYLGSTISSPIATLVAATRQVARGEFGVKLSLDSDDEVGLLGAAFEQMAGDLEVFNKKMARSAALAAIGETATQVAHDIRSPLSSLDAAIDRLKRDPSGLKDTLNMLELATKRLSGIADDLLKKRGAEAPAKRVFSIHEVLDELVGEWTSLERMKGMRFHKEYREAIECLGDRERVQRAIGNIIKNGIEAMRDEGVITLRTWVEGETGVVSITDGGHGMSKEVLARVLEGHHAGGKDDGHGIGMTVVADVLKEHGGTLEAESALGQGTTFRVKLPVGSARSFELVMEQGGPLVVIEDDPSVLLQWELIAKAKAFSIRTYSSYEDFLKDPADSASAVVDYHFNNSELNGIDVIGRLKEKGFVHLTLCTAEYWKPRVQEEARAVGAAVCPKPIPQIEVRHEYREGGPETVLIDDDPLVQATWKIIARSHGKKLETFSRPEEFLAEAGRLSKDTAIYIDVELGEGARGDELAKRLHAEGFTNLYLATGHAPGSFPAMAWIRGIVGKQAPWT